MKRIASLLLAAALLCLAACSAPVSADAVPTVVATPAPTAQPTPSPVPTEEPLTEGQQMYLAWQNSAGLGDVYACLAAHRAYENGELDAMMQSGEVAEADVEALANWNGLFCDLYDISLDSILNEADAEILSDNELYIRIVLGLEVKGICFDLPALYQSAQENLLRNGHTVLLAFSSGSQEKIREMLSLYGQISAGSSFAGLDEKLRGDDLGPLEKLYVVNYIFSFNAVNQTCEDPAVTYNGQSMSFSDYSEETQLYANAQAGMEAYLTAHYPISPDDPT